jgi:hypothetical protein
MSTSTRHIARVVIQQIITTTNDHTGTGFGSATTAKTTERVITELDTVVADTDLGGVVAKATYALKLAFPTIPATEAPVASPSS